MVAMLVDYKIVLIQYHCECHSPQASVKITSEQTIYNWVEQDYKGKNKVNNNSNLFTQQH